MTSLICQDRFHEDEYENGKVLPLLRADMATSKCCVACHESREDQSEFNRQNDPDRR